MWIHVRLLRPILSITLMFMTLPLVLGGYGRNMFINLGFALGNSGMFYAGVMLCQYLGSNEVLAPSLAAWLPLFVFALLATVRGTGSGREAELRLLISYTSLTYPTELRPPASLRELLAKRRESATRGGEQEQVAKPVVVDTLQFGLQRRSIGPEAAFENLKYVS